MKAGNIEYKNLGDLPKRLPVFALSGALLLPGGQLPLNIFEPRFLKMIEDAIVGDRLIAMVQPLEEQEEGAEDTKTSNEPSLYQIGCVGRITAIQESGDGRLLLNLSGICRYKLHSKIESDKAYPIYSVEYFESDLSGEGLVDGVDRDKLLQTFRDYLEANEMEADWESIEETQTDQLVNGLCMMSPYGPAEKQAMLEAGDLVTRAETLIAITEFELAKSNGEVGSNLQ